MPAQPRRGHAISRGGDPRSNRPHRRSGVSGAPARIPRPRRRVPSGSSTTPRLLAHDIPGFWPKVFVSIADRHSCAARLSSPGSAVAPAHVRSRHAISDWRRRCLGVAWMLMMGLAVGVQARYSSGGLENDPAVVDPRATGARCLIRLASGLAARRAVFAAHPSREALRALLPDDAGGNRHRPQPT
jgi:hypothetical protein